MIAKSIKIRNLNRAFTYSNTIIWRHAHEKLTMYCIKSTKYLSYYATLCSCSATCICYKGDSWCILLQISNIVLICRESNTAMDSSMESVYMVWARLHAMHAKLKCVIGNAAWLKCLTWFHVVEISRAGLSTQQDPRQNQR